MENGFIISTSYLICWLDGGEECCLCGMKLSSDTVFVGSNFLYAFMQNFLIMRKTNLNQFKQIFIVLQSFMGLKR